MVSVIENGAEWPDALRLAEAFHRAGVWSDAPLDIEAVGEFFDRAASSDDGYIAFSKDALILGMVMPLWFSPSLKVGAELIWFSERQGAGKAMREGFEAWAKSRGAEIVQCSCMANEHEPALRRIFARAGYAPVEVGFRKAV